MKTIALQGHIDEQHRLVAQAPVELKPGPVTVTVVVDSEETGEKEWMEGIAKEWHEELADETQDIYTLSDGEPTE